MPDTFAFIDTSILLHYRAFDDVDWRGFLSVHNVTIVIAPVTISELNEKKDEGSPKLRQRAQMTIRKLEAIWEKGAPYQVREGVALAILDVEPNVDYAAHQLDYRCQDDRLLGSILQFRAKKPDTKVLLIAADFGLRVKARRHGIEALSCPDEERLPEEPDANEKKIQQLERELLDLKRAMPILELSFRDQSNRIEVSVEPPVAANSESVEAEVARLRTEHPKMDEGPSGKFPEFAAFLAPSRAAVRQYNADLESFFRQYADWLVQNARQVNRERLTVQLGPQLVNSGTAPAKDVDIFLDFPDGFEVFNEDDLPQGPKKPSPPERPRSPLDYPVAGFGNFGHLLEPSFGKLGREFVRRNVSTPRVRRTNSYEVSVHVGELKHNFVEPLGLLYVIFGSHSQLRSFGIDYKIVAANVPRAVEGKLHVVVKCDTQP